MAALIAGIAVALFIVIRGIVWGLNRLSRAAGGDPSTDHPMLSQTPREIATTLLDAVASTASDVFGPIFRIIGAGIAICACLLLGGALVGKTGDVVSRAPAAYRDWKRDGWIRDCAKYSELADCNRRYLEIENSTSRERLNDNTSR